VPYGTFPAKDGTFILAIGNDAQFARFADLAGAPGHARAAPFGSTAGGGRHRAILVPLRAALTEGRPAADWLAACAAAGVPAGPVNDLAQVFASPQVAARGMRISMAHGSGGHVNLIGNPLKMSQTPVTYAKAPPLCGEDTGAVLSRHLGMTAEEMRALADAGVIEGNLDA
jgi:crotonobetainyl-CoA:carnitine CoA-transferase CaiB-like acyl-CoA transferase